MIPESDWYCDYCVLNHNILTTLPTAGIFDDQLDSAILNRNRRNQTNFMIDGSDISAIEARQQSLSDNDSTGIMMRHNQNPQIRRRLRRQRDRVNNENESFEDLVGFVVDD